MCEGPVCFGNMTDDGEGRSAERRGPGKSGYLEVKAFRLQRQARPFEVNGRSTLIPHLLGPRLRSQLRSGHPLGRRMEGQLRARGEK
jgi:hypothetical protein